MGGQHDGGASGQDQVGRLMALKDLLTPCHSRDRINFSRAMLKRFIRDCVVRDPAVYSPWLVKPSVAERYGVETEMPESVRESIQRFRDIQMDKRKRDRDERLGITHDDKSSEVETVEDKPKTKKQKKEEERRLREEEKEREKEEAAKKKKPLKYPAEGQLFCYIEGLS